MADPILCRVCLKFEVGKGCAFCSYDCRERESIRKANEKWLARPSTPPKANKAQRSFVTKYPIKTQAGQKPPRHVEAQDFEYEE